MRHALLVVLGLVALSFPALAASANQGKAPTKARHAPGALGIVPPHVAGATVSGAFQSPRPSFPGVGSSPFADPFGNPNNLDNLTYGGPDQTPAGQVMTHVTNYAIYWVPSGYATAKNYQSVVDGYFQNVATDSSGSQQTNAFGAATQYGNPTTNPFTGSVAFGGSAVDKQPFPQSDCTRPPDVIGTKVCLSDAALQTEIKRFADAQEWPHGPNVEFFLYTAANVESCFYAEVGWSGSNVCSYDWYCAYHSNFLDNSSQDYVYSNMPWPNQKVNFGGPTYPSDCDSFEHPNGTGSYPKEKSPTPLDAADEVINVTSHESNESITDSDGFEWWNDNNASAYAGYENGDMCAWYTPNSAVLGSTKTGQFNQIIGNGLYYTQPEWSNASANSNGYSGCVWNYPAVSPPSNTVAPGTPTGTPGTGNILTAPDTGTWDGSPKLFATQWERCDGAGSNCTAIAGANGSTYKAAKGDAGFTLAVDVTATNAGGSADAESAATGVITALFPYILSTAPTLTPATTATVGNVLNGTSGAWANAPTSFKYVVERCDNSGLNCKPAKTIGSKLPAITYTLVKADDKHTMVLTVLASNAKGNSGVPVATAATAVVDGEPVNTGTPSFTSGTANIGSTLTADPGTWSPAAISYKTTWERCSNTGTNCKAIKSVTTKPLAPSSTYKLAAVDVNHQIAIVVTATNLAGSSDPTDAVLTATVS
jgi:hypothetical protein